MYDTFRGAFRVRALYRRSSERASSSRDSYYRVKVAFEDVDQIRPALERFAAGDGDLADWLIWERSRAAAAESVFTFDGRLLRAPEFVDV